MRMKKSLRLDTESNPLRNPYEVIGELYNTKAEWGYPVVNRLVQEFTPWTFDGPGIGQESMESKFEEIVRRTVHDTVKYIDDIGDFKLDEYGIFPDDVAKELMEKWNA